MPRALRALAVALALVAAGPAAAQTWAVDPAHTVSGFSVRHLMIANVTGVFEDTRGTIVYTPGDPLSVRVDIAIDARSVNTRIARRDNDLRSDNFLNAERYPTITFKSTRVQSVRPGGFDLVGDLTIRDVTRQVVLKVDGPTPVITDPQGGRRVGATATTTISRKDFNVNWNRARRRGGRGR